MRIILAVLACTHNRLSRMEGFIVFDYAAQYGQARKELAQWLAEGKLQRKETIISGGLDAAQHALVALYEGINTGTLFCLHFLISLFWTNFIQASYWLRSRPMKGVQDCNTPIGRAIRW